MGDGEELRLAEAGVTGALGHGAGMVVAGEHE